MYSDKVVDHYTNPRNVGEIENASGIGEVGNPVCGDVMKIYLKIENEIITDVKFKTYGCGAAIAASSVTTEMVKGKSIQEALKITNEQVVEELGGLPPIKVHCSVLAEEAIKTAIADYYRKQGGLSEEEIEGICKISKINICSQCCGVKKVETYLHN